MSRMIRKGRRGRILILLALVLILVSACRSPSTPEAPNSPLPSPEHTQSEQTSATTRTFDSVLPTPDPDHATVTGQLVRAKNGEPVKGVVVFLEQTTEDHKVPQVLYAPPNEQPSTKTNERGVFVISDVPVDEYVVILYSPPYSPQVITQPDGDQVMLINAEAGKVANVGTVRVTEFELP